MATTFYGIGSHRLIYKSENFGTGKVVTAYIWNHSLVKSALQTFTEVSDGLYYLNYYFAATGTYFGKFYEDAAATVSGTFKVVAAIDTMIPRILSATEIKQAVVNDATASTTKFITTLSETSNDFWNRQAVLFTSGANSGQLRAIKDYNGSSKEITIQFQLDEAPSDGDTFIIPTQRKYLTPDIEDIADQTWDELIADHTGATTFGGKNQKVVPSETLSDYKADLTSLNDITVAEIVAGVADGSYDLQEMIRLIFAACCCKSTGGGSSTLNFRDSGDAKNRITAVVDSNGNRTGITLDGS